MRRSFRDAIVGFSLIGGVVLFSGLTLWLKGLRINSNAWNIRASFEDASGLSVGTPVNFRGIQIGSVREITFTPKDVQTKIRINQNNLILPKPVFAKIKTSSLLGGDAAISLIAKGDDIGDINSYPKKENCPQNLILCEGDLIKGKEIESISSLTSDINRFISEAESKGIIQKMVKSIDQFDKTQENLDELIMLSKLELVKARPIIEELIQAVNHINSILSAFDDPQVIGDIKISTSSIRVLIAKMNEISYKLNEIVSDEDLTNAIKDAAIGIGKLFNDIYE